MPTDLQERCPQCCFTGNIEFDNWDSASPQLKTVLAFIQAMRDWNIESLESTLSDDYQMEVLPRSLGIAMRGREGWINTCRNSSILEPGYRVDIIDINESPGRIWIHATVYARAKTGQAYENEYMLMFRLTTDDADKPKILELKEFMDSLYTTNFALDHGLRQASKLCHAA